jgi:hypothetical protein
MSSVTARPNVSVISTYSRAHAFPRLLERTKVGRPVGVPAHLYRRAAIDLAGYGRRLVRGGLAGAFTHEVGHWFFGGFCEARCRESFSSSGAAGTSLVA